MVENNWVGIILMIPQKKGLTDGSRHCQVVMPPNKGTRLLIVHCGSSDGWVDGALKLSETKNG